MKPKFYIGTPIYYVNDVPHIGHAYTTLAADIITRYQRKILGNENVFFVVGTDEHGQKVAQAAKEHGLTPKEYADSVAPRFKEAWKLLNINYDYFVRTTNPDHEKVVTDLLTKIRDNGYIKEGVYEGLYCIGCEAFKTENDLVNGKCPLHPNKEPIYQKERNYFLKLSELSQRVLEKIENNEYEILPEERKKEVVSRLKQGVEDISISRAGVSWGIPIPWDKKQTVYVWVDAILYYYSTTQYLENKKRFWPVDLHLIGKDILWFHTVIWQALLIAAGIELPKAVFAHGFFTIDGQKISKSLGNVISPKELVDKYGVDGTRYLIASAYPFGSDGDISFSRFDEKYNSDLANGLGNLVARVSSLCEKSGFNFPAKKTETFDIELKISFDKYKFDEALKTIWDKIKELDQLINAKKVWELKGEELKKVLEFLVADIRQIAFDLEPFLPVTAEKISKQFNTSKIKQSEALFPRLK